MVATERHGRVTGRVEASGQKSAFGRASNLAKFDPKTHKLLGVHALGQRATEIIHIGQAVLFYGGSVEYFHDMVFVFSGLFAWAPWRFNLAAGGEVRYSQSLMIGGDFFRTLGVRTVLGRAYTLLVLAPGRGWPA